MGLKIYIYQIAYDQPSLAQVQSGGFLHLDNMQNSRPDWYEYWPIRQFLLSNVLDDDAWYGFFSPKFSEKTLLSHAATCDFITQATAQHPVDVVLFSPQPDMGANFLNVFEQAELFDPGFIQVAKQFFQALGLNIPLESIVMDSRQVVFSNYFVAKPKFWREWFTWTEALFSMAEDSAHPLYAGLNHNTSYSETAPRKVFLMERLASLLLYLKPEYKTVAANPYQFAWSMSKFRERPENAYINDALKMAYRETGFPQYMDAFRKIRQQT
jgi:hypothetical protein